MFLYYCCYHWHWQLFVLVLGKAANSQCVAMSLQYRTYIVLHAIVSYIFLEVSVIYAPSSLVFSVSIVLSLLRRVRMMSNSIAAKIGSEKSFRRIKGDDANVQQHFCQQSKLEKNGREERARERMTCGRRRRGVRENKQTLLMLLITHRVVVVLWCVCVYHVPVSRWWRWWLHATLNIVFILCFATRIRNTLRHCTQLYTVHAKKERRISVQWRHRASWHSMELVIPIFGPFYVIFFFFVFLLWFIFIFLLFLVIHTATHSFSKRKLSTSFELVPIALYKYIKCFGECTNE